MELARWFGPASGRLRAGAGFRSRRAQFPVRPQLRDPLSWRIFSAYGQELSAITGLGRAGPVRFGEARMEPAGAWLPAAARRGHAASQDQNKLRICRRITRSFLESGTLVWYGRDRG